MFRVVVVQFAVVLLVSALAAIFGGAMAAVSALFGGLACAVPNALFALHLALSSRVLPSGTRDASSLATRTALSLLAGEMFKVLFTVALLALAASSGLKLVWPALIISLIAVLLSQPAAYAWRRP